MFLGSGDQRSIHAELRAHEVQVQESSRIALGGRFGICVHIVSIQTPDRSSLLLQRSAAAVLGDGVGQAVESLHVGGLDCFDTRIGRFDRLDYESSS